MEQVGSGRLVACQKEVLGVVALTALSPEGFCPLSRGNKALGACGETLYGHELLLQGVGAVVL